MKEKEASSSDDGLSVLTGILEEPTDVNCGPLLCKRLSELLHLRQAEDPAFANSTAVIEQTVRVEALNASQATQHVEGGIEEPQSVTFGELNALVDAAAARLQTQLSDLPFSRNLAKLTDCADLSGERRAQIERLQERSLVIVCMPTSLGRVVIQLACMKLRLAYTPVDRHFPQKQISRILHEFAPVACIVEEDSEDGGSFLSNQGTETVNLISSSALFTWEYVNQLRNASKCGVSQCCRALFATVTDPVILVLFTSGSTSPTPKGVALRNRQLMNRLAWQWSPASPLAGLTGPSLVKTSWLFVDAFTEVFGALLAGRPILLPISPQGHLSTVQMFTDASLLAFLVHKFAVVQLTVVPEQLKSWLVQIDAAADCDLIGHFSSLEVLVVSGQLLPVRLATDVFRIFAGGRIRLINLYGSTEVAGDVTVAVFESLEDVLGSRQTENSTEVDGAFFLPVGLPIQNCEVYVLTRRSEEDECGELHVLPRGETGEVYVSGAAVPTDGKIYADAVKSPQALSGKAVNAPTLPNAFSSRSGFLMLFRTGDLGFVSPSNSQLYVCGRCDDTVKVNGVKCNLTAIDSFLTGVIDDVISNPKSQYRRFASLRATVTLLIESIQRKAQLVCFYIQKDDSSAGAEAESFTSLDLAKLIGGNLPSFVNVKVVQVNAFPTKPISGKIDKVKLKENYLADVYTSAKATPRRLSESGLQVRHLNDRERAREIFAKILGIETSNQSAPRPLDDEDFSQLGGDSMTVFIPFFLHVHIQKPKC
uniref:AMP-dependent synthetase/ligase domain-containing protein n=1 Tax=Schistocephalus solidus TaxID=70667 RepID=A0A0X3Q0J4_SCHSO